MSEISQILSLEESFDGLYGLEVIDFDRPGEELRGRVPVTDRVRQVYGMVHGGVYAAMAEALASFGTYRAVAADGKTGIGISNHTSFMRPITEGTVHAVARPRHRGRATWVWDVEISDDDGHVCALARVTIAVRAGGKAEADAKEAEIS